MTNRWMLTVLPVLVGTVNLLGGALLLEVGNPEANPEAKKVGALLVARATACTEPAKSIVTAAVLRMNGTSIERVPLTVTRLSGEGVFAVTGQVPGQRAVIELAVTNPEYRDYQPRTLVRVEQGAIQWSSLKRFYSVPPRTEEVKQLLASAGE